MNTKERNVYVCASCGKPIYRLSSQCKSINTFCNKDCYNAYKLGKVPHNKGKNQIFEKPCSLCGKLIIGEKSFVAKRKYCSRECSKNGQQIYYVKENGKYTKLYLVWRGIKNRCNNKSAKGYNRYGGRGISVCEEWEKGFSPFRDWAFDNGYKEGVQIDRINNDGNYEPSNCKWSTRKEQCINRENTVYITINGMTKTINGWSDYSGLSREVIRKRYYTGKLGNKLISKGDD